jgi:hypothetical protein
MSGYMVTTTDGAPGYRNFYMVNADDPDRARDLVIQLMSSSSAQTLAPIPDETLDHYNVEPGQAWLCTTTGPNGEVTNNQLR